MDPLLDQTLDAYGFGNQNPVRFVDPTGMSGEDWVQRGDGSIYWDNNATSQAMTKAGETYLGKTLSFEFNSYIDAANWDGPLGNLPEGNKLTTNIELTAHKNSAGELIGLSAAKTTDIGETFGIFQGRNYYPGKGGNNNYFKISESFQNININYEQHASVPNSFPAYEEKGMNIMGFKIVDVAQKLNISFDKGSGNLSVSAYTNIFPSATLKLNNTGTTLMYYKQPSFIKTHTAPIKGYIPTMGSAKIPVYDFTYYPSKFYKRN